MAPKVVALLCSFPPGEKAAEAARSLVDQRLAACATLLPGATSTYRWEGEVEEAAETLLIAKTTQPRLAALMAALKALHPYDVPEMIALPVAAGWPPYLDWVAEETSPPA